MKHSIIEILSIIALVGLTIIPAGCKKDFSDPNRATQEQVFSSPKGLTGAAVGLQRVYTLGRGSTLYNLVTINGLTTNELIVVNPGNTAEVQLAAGGKASRLSAAVRRAGDDLPALLWHYGHYVRYVRAQRRPRPVAPPGGFGFRCRRPGSGTALPAFCAMHLFAVHRSTSSASWKAHCRSGWTPY